MMVHEITGQVGAHRPRKRVGRGESSGLGKTCGRGHKGCNSRSGGGTRPLHEGGQMPLFRRIPKRGFSNYNFRTAYETVALRDLERHYDAGETVDLESLRKHRLVERADGQVKLLGTGTLTKALTIEAHAATAGAKAAIEKAGGTLKLIEQQTAGEKWRAKRGSKKKSKAGAAPAPTGAGSAEASDT